MGIAASTVKAYAAGNSHPSAYMLEHISEKMGVDPAFFVTGNYSSDQIVVLVKLMDIRQHRTIQCTHLACRKLRHMSQNPLTMRQHGLRNFVPSAEVADCAICAQQLCGVAITKLLEKASPEDRCKFVHLLWQMVLILNRVDDT